MAWDKRSPRRARLPANWNKIRELVLARDPLCLIGFVGCTGRSTEVDHIVAGADDDRPEALQGCCRHCHAIKSSQEGTAVQRERRQARQRPKPPHPGLRREP